MKKILKESLVEAFLFFGLFFITLQVDWMKVFHLTPISMEIDIPQFKRGQG